VRILRLLVLVEVVLFVLLVVTFVLLVVPLWVGDEDDNIEEDEEVVDVDEGLVVVLAVDVVDVVVMVVLDVVPAPLMALFIKLRKLGQSVPSFIYVAGSSVT